MRYCCEIVEQTLRSVESYHYVVLRGYKRSTFARVDSLWVFDEDLDARTRAGFLGRFPFRTSTSDRRSKGPES